MSQFVAAKIERRLAQLAQAAWPDGEGRADIGMPITTQAAPKITAFCPEIPREPGTVRANRFMYACTVFGRFPLSSVHPSDEKDARANALYEAVVGADPQRVGALYDAEGGFLANNLRVSGVDRKDYVPDGAKPAYFDVAVTFTMQADAPY